MFTMCTAVRRAPALTRAEKPRRATPLNSDDMIKLGDVQYQTEPNLSTFPK